MRPCPRPATPDPAFCQQGAALIAILTLLGMGTLYLYVKQLDAAQARIARDRITAAALSQAREALIGRAAADDNRPGSLPCPDLVTNIPGNNIPGDGKADMLAGNQCPSYVGWLPWRTLGLTELRDGTGERLWYAFSPSLRDDESAQPINSNTAGELVLGTTNQVAAIVFAAGPPLPGQSRPSSNPADYLDGSNADGDTAYAADTASESFNDRALTITRAELMAAVESRIAAEARNLLKAFYTNSSAAANSRHFPYAAALGTNLPSSGLRRGLLPVSCRFQRSGPPPNHAYVSTCSGPADFVSQANFRFIAATGACDASGFPDRCQCGAGAGTCTGERIDTAAAAALRSSISLDALQIRATGTMAPVPPDWLMDNRWELMIFFAVAAGCTAATPGCASGAMLSAGHLLNLAAVVITTGTPLASTEAQNTAQSGYPSGALCDYLDSEENADDNDLFGMPGKARTRTYNDTIIAMPRGSL